MPTFMACIDALSAAPSVSTRMQSSRASTILSTKARDSASACAFASRGRAATISIVCRQAREASPYWRSQIFCASRCASRRRRRSTRMPSSGGPAGRSRVPGAVSWLVGSSLAAASAPLTSASLAAARAGCGSSGVISPPSSRQRSLCCGLQRTRPRPSERIVATCAGVVMRKLLSGNGCDIQPTSR